MLQESKLMMRRDCSGDRNIGLLITVSTCRDRLALLFV
jgi:hypothetical protein